MKKFLAILIATGFLSAAFGSVYHDGGKIEVATEVSLEADGNANGFMLTNVYDGFFTNVAATVAYVQSLVGGGGDPFTGPGTTGTVTSVVGDAGKFLNADGTWKEVSSAEGSNAWAWVQSNSNGVAYMLSRTSAWDQAVIDSTFATNWISTNSLANTNWVIANFLSSADTTNVIPVSAVTFNGHVIPTASNTYDLGSAEFPWRSLYVTTNTIYMGDSALSITEGGQIVTQVGTNDPVVGVQIGDNVSDLTNNAGYLTAYVETDPIWVAVSNSYALQSWVSAQNYLTSIPANDTTTTNIAQLFTTADIHPLSDVTSTLGSETKRWNVIYTYSIADDTVYGKANGNFEPNQDNNYDLGGSSAKWQTVYANSLSDGITIAGSGYGATFTPNSDGSYDLGSSSAKWNNVYANYLSEGIQINGNGFGGNLQPNSDGSYDLGGSSYKWNTVYANRIDLNSKASIYLDPSGLTISNTEGDIILSGAANSAVIPSGGLNLGSESTSWQTNYVETLNNTATPVEVLTTAVAGKDIVNFETATNLIASHKGQVYITTTGEQNIGTGDTYQAITNMVATNVVGMTSVAADGSLTAKRANLYYCAYNAGFAGGSSELYEFAIFVNGVEQSNIETKRKTSNNDVGSAGGNGLLNLDVDDVVTLRIKTDGTGAADFDPVKVSLTLFELK